MDERQVYERLYGRQTRSGKVRLTPLFPGRDGLMAGTPRERMWMDWDTIEWFPLGRSISAFFNSVTGEVFSRAG